MIHNFRELVVWQKSMELTKQVYAQTKAFPSHELYGLTSQIQRAAVSIPTNIAEGAGRSTNKDLCHFLSFSIGSAYELETELSLAKEFEYISADVYEDLHLQLIEVQKMLYGLINKHQNINDGK